MGIKQVKDGCWTFGDGEGGCYPWPVAENGGGNEWKKIADVTLEEDVTAIEITKDINGGSISCTELIYYFKSITYNTELTSGTTNESIIQWYNGTRISESLPFTIRAGTKNNPETYYSMGKYNSLTGEMYGISSTANASGNLQTRNNSFPLNNKINTIKLGFSPVNRWWAIGTTLTIFGR